MSQFIVPRTISLTEAMRVIDHNEQGTVILVDENDRLVGTVTDGDIRRGILDGLDLDAPAEAVMTEDAIHVRESWSRTDIASNVSADTVRERAGLNGTLLAPVLDENDRVTDVTHLSDDLRRIGETATFGNGVQTVLIIGGAGYLGSTIARQLLDRGYDVRVLDNLLYGDHGIRSLYEHERFSFMRGDMRNIEAVTQATNGADAVLYLGALVGDPASSLDAQKTLEMNYHAATMAARLCDYHQINRFVFASTCSVYGRGDDSEMLFTERSPTNPLSLYAKTKLDSEETILELADGNFAPTMLRMATLYGLSPRMRFDLVVNVLSAKAHTEGIVPIFGGEQYRPNVHVADAARAFISCLEAPIDDVSGEVFNVGSNEQNHRIKTLGEIVADCFPDAEIDRHHDKEDDRSYRVEFSKIHEMLGFEVDRTIRDGVNEIKAAFERDALGAYTDEKYHNYKSLENDTEKLSVDATPVRK